MQLLFLYILATVFQIIDMFIIKTKINNELRGITDPTFTSLALSASKWNITSNNKPKRTAL